MIWIVIGGVILILWFVIKSRSDQKSFQVIPFKVKFNALINHFSVGYFDGECSLYEPLKTEVRMVGDGLHSNKYIKMFFSRNVLYLDIRIKLYQVEYKKKYRLDDPLLKTDEALIKFGDKVALDFGSYLDSKTG